jgi:leucyl/phenylalanyl-tRNA--protein transferase
MSILPPYMLLEAYAQGYFPMAMPDGEIGWFSPESRGILPLGPRRWPHGVRRDLRKEPWEVRCDTAFPEVLRGCAERSETWINQVIHDSYTALFRAGKAHSVEVWLEGELVGGLYGVHLGGAFFGESMFSRRSGASKVALVWLVENLTAAGFSLLDTQWTTAHLGMFGGEEISRKAYLRCLRQAIRIQVPFPALQCG